MLAAPSAPLDPLTAVFVSPIAVLSLVPSRSSGTCSMLGLSEGSLSAPG